MGGGNQTQNKILDLSYHFTPSIDESFIIFSSQDVYFEKENILSQRFSSTQLERTNQTSMFSLETTFSLTKNQTSNGIFDNDGNEIHRISVDNINFDKYLSNNNLLPLIDIFKLKCEKFFCDKSLNFF